MQAGKRFQGGTLKGIKDKLEYLQGIGITTLWVGPIFRQRPDQETYHGYGIQNFLDVDPRFGTRQDLRDLVDSAHERGMYVLLDIIYNHTGNNWFYSKDGEAQEKLPYRFTPPHAFHGWRSATGESIPTIQTLDDGVWPVEFQTPDWYTRAGEVGDWSSGGLDPNAEFRRGDFDELKDLKLNEREWPAGEVLPLSALIRVYKYWIALSDCDGFRIDTVKHVSWEASRNFCGSLREFAESIGKENFLLLGEVAGGAEITRDYLDVFGRNLDAALDIGDAPLRLSGMVKGVKDPSAFFNQFKEHDSLGSHREVGRYHVSVLDDHDMIGRDGKYRFSAGSEIPESAAQVAHAVGVQLTTLGIPCIYYGTEQAFDGTEGRHDLSIEPRQPDGKVWYIDRYVRETMFGGTFGPFQTAGCHFFDPEHPTYLRIAAIARVRSRPDWIGLALRRGRQYPRATSFMGSPFSMPGAGELVGWSRLLNEQEVLVVLNTHGKESRGAEVTVHAPAHPDGSHMTFLYRSDWSDAELLSSPRTQVAVVSVRDGRASVRIDLPAAGMAILA